MSPSLWSRVLTRRQVLKALVASGVGLTAGTASYGYFIERYQVGVTDVPLPVDGLPQPLEGLRVGILTDPHVSGTVPPVVVARAVELLRAQAPDVIVLGGDYISWGDVSYVERAAEQLRTLTAPFGVFAVFGNHDDEGRLEAALSRAVTAYHHRTRWDRLVRQAMRLDHSWRPSAERYQQVYTRAVARRRREA